MPIVHQIPIAVTSLNYNIDADLNLGIGYYIKSQRFLAYATGGMAALFRDIDTDALSLRGSTNVIGHGAVLDIFGYGLTGRFRFSTPNAAGNADIIAAEIIGNVASPYLDMNTHQIKSLLDPIAAQDAATKNYCDTTLARTPGAAYTPVLTWGGVAPSGVTAAARWSRDGKIVHYVINIYSADSNGTTGLTVTLPTTPGNYGVYWSASSFERYGILGNTWGNPMAVVTSNSNLLTFFNFQVPTDGQLIYLFISGWYEDP